LTSLTYLPIEDFFRPFLQENDIEETGINENEYRIQ
jgi:hypothetical protein